MIEGLHTQETQHQTESHNEVICHMPQHPVAEFMELESLDIPSDYRRM